LAMEGVIPASAGMTNTVSATGTIKEPAVVAGMLLFP